MVLASWLFGQRSSNQHQSSETVASPSTSGPPTSSSFTFRLKHHPITSDQDNTVPYLDNSNVLLNNNNNIDSANCNNRHKNRIGESSDWSLFGSADDRERNGQSVNSSLGDWGHNRRNEKRNVPSTSDGSRAKRPRLSPATSLFRQDVRSGFRIGRFLSAISETTLWTTSKYYMEMAKNWIRADDQDFDPVHRIDASVFSESDSNYRPIRNFVSEEEEQTGSRLSPPCIDLTVDEEERKTALTSQVPVNYRVSPISADESSPELRLNRDDDISIIEETKSAPEQVLFGGRQSAIDEQKNLGAVPSETFTARRRWTRSQADALPSGVRIPVQLQRPAIERDRTGRPSVQFNHNRLTSRLLADSHSNDKYKHKGNFPNVINIEERERYRQFLEGLGAGQVSFSQPRPYKSADIQATSRTTRNRLRNRKRQQEESYRDRLNSSHALLVDLVSDDEDEGRPAVIEGVSPSLSPGSNVTIASDSGASSNDFFSYSRQRGVHRWNQEKASELNRKLAFDPSVFSQKTRKEILAAAERRDQKAKELQLEGRLREEARHRKEKDLDETVRLRLRFDGLVIPDYAEPVEQFPELSEKDSNIVEEAWGGGRTDEVFAEKFDMKISRHDLMTLNGLEWLNDEVINFYLQLIVERAKHDQNVPQTYAFNTFFYGKLSQSGHSSVKRWTRKTDVFAYDILLVPVHLGAHWCLAVIDVGKKRIEYFDSMGGRNQKCLNDLSEYLKAESRDKKKKEYDMSDWEYISRQDIPLQMNGSDCGMFACKFAEYSSRRAPITFSQDHMPYFRRRMTAEICRLALI